MLLRELFTQSDTGNEIRSDLIDLLTMAKSNNILKIDLNTLTKQLASMGYPFDKSGIKQLVGSIQMVKNCDDNFVYLIGYQDGEETYNQDEVDQKVSQLAQKVADKDIG
jgi:uncharacterized radical SAM superfamily Fe-S cluster-containing enzyme